MKVLVAGSTGLIGSALVAALKDDGAEVVRLVRPGTDRRRLAADPSVPWDPDRGKLDPKALEGFDAVVNLAGANIAGGRWTKAYKLRLRESRLATAGLLAETLAGLSRKPKVFVSVSALGVYGDRGEVEIDETSPPGRGFLAFLGQEWEHAADPARRAGVRIVHPRLGLVLSPKGGILGRMLPPFQVGLGAVLGSGKQWMSWVTLSDAVKALRFLLKEDAPSGPVNVAAPHPVRNEEFVKTLGRVLRRPVFLRAPAFALKALVGEMAEEGLLASCRMVPLRLTEAGFAFDHPELEGALRALLRKPLR